MTNLAALPDDSDADLTAEAIARCQLANGFITWFREGHGDPWNHVEAAMALDAMGCGEDAVRAYDWCVDQQRADGSFFAFYGPDGFVEQQHVDNNATAYVATGVLHHVLSTGDLDEAHRLWPTVERAIGFVLGHQVPTGAVTWSVDANGKPGGFALVASSSAIAISLGAAARLADLVGVGGGRYRSALDRLIGALSRGGELFEPKDEFAMDWYYPVLAGVFPNDEAARRMTAGAERFLTADGVLCRSDRRWVTTAETAECAMALSRVNRHDEARAVLDTTIDKRCDDGSYLTGLVYPERSQFPPGEVTSYSAAAVLLAEDLLRGGTATSALFGEVVSDHFELG